jgi:hypothetical protein
MPLGMDLLELPWELRHNVFAKDAPYIFGVIAVALNSVGAREDGPTEEARPQRAAAFACLALGAHGVTAGGRGPPFEVVEKILANSRVRDEFS